ncbi:MAG: sulfatase, partial [Planctomycetota bacterium]
MLRFAAAGFLVLTLLTPLFGAEEAQPPNVVFILVDALRADRLSCCGYERETSPNIDEIAREGWLFTNNKAQSSYTRTSMASLFTARYTSDRSLIAAEGKGDDDRTLAEILSANGYFNIAIQTNPQLQEKWGWARGFDRYWMVRPEGFTISLEQLWWDAEPDANYFYSDAARVAEVFGEIVGNNVKKRFFIYVHMMDTHEPYIPPEEHQLFGEERLNIKEAAALSGRFISRKYESHKQGAIDLYDGEVRFADAAVGRMVECLKRHGLYDNTAVIIASDHGEEFLEHGGTRHSKGLYEEVLRTPLVMCFPGREAAVCEGLTRNVDIAPTILECAGIDPDWKDRDGVSLVGVVKGETEITSSVARLQLEFGENVNRWDAIQRGALKFIDADL